MIRRSMIREPAGAPPVNAEICFEDGVPLIPNVTPVIILSGSDYDMGYQYSQQLAQTFGLWLLEGMVHGKFTTEEVAALKAYQWYMRQYTPEMIDMFKGMADGATHAGVHLSYKEVLAHLVGTDLYPDAPPGSEHEKLSPVAPGGCSGFAAWGSTTTDGRLICAGSKDAKFAFLATVVVFPEKGNNFVFSTWTAGFALSTWGTGLSAHPAMNNKGLAFPHHGATRRISGKPTDERRYGVDRHLAVLHTLRFAGDANEAKDMMLAYPSGDGAIGGFWADIHGNAFVIESRENPTAIRRPGDYGERDFIYATNNAIHKDLGNRLNPPPEGNAYIPHGGWVGTGDTICSVPRNLEMWNMLNYYRGHVDLEFVKMMWRFPGKPPAYPTLEEADAAYYANKGEGWGQQICNAANALVGIAVPDDGDEGLYYVCTWGAARAAYPFNPGDHYYGIAPTHSFYQLKLDSSPAGVTSAAKNRAQYDLYYANTELRKLNYPDAAYAPLDEIFNRATTEWIKGDYYDGLASKTTGNDSICNWGKATRAFTRCQALARKVYNALVPPPSKPEDLGLKPEEY